MNSALRVLKDGDLAIPAASFAITATRTGLGSNQRCGAADRGERSKR